MADNTPPVIERRWQDPADVLDYTINWQTGAKPFLAPGVIITTSGWAAYGPEWAPSTEVTVEDRGHDDTTATVRVSELVADKVYVTNHVVASDGQEKDQSIQITKKEH